jgi:hypothetical protein
VHFRHALLAQLACLVVHASLFEMIAGFEQVLEP